MASVTTRSEAAKDRVTRLLVTDFCPWANRYVYWLKEPIGWFVIGLGISILVGLHISSVGWVLASVIGAVIVVGMLWPLIAVWAGRCQLHPALDEVHEGQSCELILQVTNRTPLPLWGLAIEGYLDRHGDEVSPTIALAAVPALSDAQYRLPIQPALRGRYPIVPAKIACSMPFGIWTARRRLEDFSPLTVFPCISCVQDDPDLVGGRLSEAGDGLRVGQSGEPMGVREFRNGDRLRNVHWIHTARTGVLTVCERGGPQQPQVDIRLDVQLSPTLDLQRRLRLRHGLAQRVRVAASLAVALHGHHVPIRFWIGEQVMRVGAGAAGRRKLLTALAEVPADGLAGPVTSPGALAAGQFEIRVAGDDADETAVTVTVLRPGTGLPGRPLDAEAFTAATAGPQVPDLRIGGDCSLDVVLARFWREVRHVAACA